MAGTVAIVGASGFVGTRLVEACHLGGGPPIRPVVRSYAALARLARFDLDCRIADGCDATALASAFAGCQSVVSLMVADPDGIVRSAGACYAAAAAAGVQRLVYLSSASVHGQAPAPGTTESTPLATGQPFAYNDAKVRAEHTLDRLRAGGGVEVVVLRPGIVFGPRSRWIVEAADALLDGTAAFLGRGEGICNSIYVDNLVHAIRLALERPAGHGTFLVGDREQVTWADFYRPIAAALGVDFDAIPTVPPSGAPARPPAPLRAAQYLRASAPYRALGPRLPRRLKAAARSLLEPAPTEVSPWRASRRPGPTLTAEMAALQSCRWRFSSALAHAALGYEPPVSFDEGMRRSLGWLLEFAGYDARVRRPAPGAQV